MGIGPQPGATYKVKCTNKTDHTAAFNGDISIAVSGTPEQVAYYVFGQEYLFVVRPFDGHNADGGDQAAPAS